MTIERLPWHAPHWRRLEQVLDAGRLAHALLLRGVPGLGKEHFARGVAARLLCQAGEGGERPCGSCRGCTLLAAGNHPDLVELTPLEDRRSIGIAQVRELIERLSLTASFRGAKVVLVLPAEAMTHAAANTLLKTLEEPAGAALFMLVAHRSALLPATVRSRCQGIDFHVPPEAQAVAWLQEQQPAGDATELVRLAGGAPLAALAMAPEGAPQARERLLADLAAITAGRADPVAVAEQWKALGEPPVTAALIAICEDLARIGVAAPAAALSFPRGAAALHDIASRLDLQRVHRLHGELVELRRAQASQLNFNAQLALEGVAIRWREAAGR